LKHDGHCPVEEPLDQVGAHRRRSAAGVCWIRPVSGRSGLAARARAAVLLLSVLAAGALLPTPGYGAATRAFDIVVKDGKVVGPKSVRVTKGDTVVLRWMSDRKLELHLHGYDVTTTVNPGTPAEMKIVARATGRFPVEVHGQGGAGGSHGHNNIFHLEVYPD